MKIITVCGSLKYQKEMMEAAEKMNCQGNCMLTPVYPTKAITDYTEAELAISREMHFERIRISDAILVLNINNYIGDNTKKEIDFAKSLGKEIIYYSDLF